MDKKSIIVVLILLLTLTGVFVKINHFKTVEITRAEIEDSKIPAIDDVDLSDIRPDFDSPFTVNLPVKVKTPQTKEAKILFLGDMMMGRYVRVLMERHGKDYPFAKLPEDFFKGYDLILANLEGPITKRFITGGTSLIFGFPPDTAEILKNKGINMVTLGNNHTLNRGEEGVKETHEYLSKQGIDYLGRQGFENEETSLKYKYINGLTLAFISLHDAERRINEETAAELVKTAAISSSYTIVLPHWGLEYKHKPTERQRNLAHEWINLGADLIVGHHPHVVQEIEQYNGKYIFYSLGNFVFDQYFSVDVQEELALAATFTAKGINFKLIPMKSLRSQSSLMDEAAAAKFLQKLNGWGKTELEMEFK